MGIVHEQGLVGRQQGRPAGMQDDVGIGDTDTEHVSPSSWR
jgi:hypothetical protein